MKRFSQREYVKIPYMFQFHGFTSNNQKSWRLWTYDPRVIFQRWQSFLGLPINGEDLRGWLTVQLVRFWWWWVWWWWWWWWWWWVWLWWWWWWRRVWWWWWWWWWGWRWWWWGSPWSVLATLSTSWNIIIYGTVAWELSQESVAWDLMQISRHLDLDGVRSWSLISQWAVSTLDSNSGDWTGPPTAHSVVFFFPMCTSQQGEDEVQSHFPSSLSLHSMALQELHQKEWGFDKAKAWRQHKSS